MATVFAGARLVLRTAEGSVTLRALQDVVLADSWSVPVLAPLRALQEGDGVVEMATDTGLFSAAAHLRVTEGVLELLPGSSRAPALLQRRGDVRGRLGLPLRAIAADGAAERALGDAIVEGVTVDVSVGGIGVDVHPRSVITRRGSRLYVELTLPDGDLVPAVVSVVRLADRRLHARFVDVAPADAERLARLVFSAERAELAARARRRDERGS
jgi:subtilisin family serine protease